MRAKQTYQQMVYLTAYGYGLKPMDKARLNLTFVYKDNRRRDVDNLTAMFKPGLDALVLAGLLQDDNSECLTMGEVKVVVDKTRAPRTIITLEEVGKE
jgi:Holliday junction resolvase RusA-like endonuclease